MVRHGAVKGQLASSAPEVPAESSMPPPLSSCLAAAAAIGVEGRKRPDSAAGAVFSKFYMVIAS